MADMHDIVTVGIPLIAILAGILFNRSDIIELRAEMHTLHGEVLVRLSQIDADLRQFYHLSGKLEGRLDAIEKRN
jgi:hypothetical protein